MKFASTRGEAPQVGFSQALLQGLAPDGGLYVPTQWPAVPAGIDAGESLASIGERVIGAFAAGDELEGSLPAILHEAFDFPAPLVGLADNSRLSVLELFHGPTAAFKDFGARFLAASMSRIPRPQGRTLRILVATSGDTGGAVAAAFHRRPGLEVVVLFPKGGVSPTQQQQLTCWGDNVTSLAVRGTFDDCQRLVKEAFLDPGLSAGVELSSANSINLGRLLPQAVYYAASSLMIERMTGQRACYVIPSGNLGNSVACVWARQMGFPIERIVLAHNANRTVPDYLVTGQLMPRPSVATLASAMDVGNPSNLERMLALYPDAPAMATQLSAMSVSDAQIRERIRTDYARHGKVWCPHTATAAEVYANLPASDRAGHPWVLVATAHPAKFREIVEPLVGTLPVPENLQRLFELPSRFSEIDPTLQALQHATDRS
ncbi:MAG: Threonine synthase [Pseudomonadota bacterium]|jgi:threonine synthase